MSLTGPDFWRPEQGGVMPSSVGESCFLCGQLIGRDPGWMWAGATGEIFFHVGCAADFLIRMGSDLSLWQRQTGRRFAEMDSR